MKDLLTALDNAIRAALAQWKHTRHMQRQHLTDDSPF